MLLFVRALSLRMTVRPNPFSAFASNYMPFLFRVILCLLPAPEFPNFLEEILINNTKELAVRGKSILDQINVSQWASLNRN